jgi:Arylsulfotransferase (ASST)
MNRCAAGFASVALLSFGLLSSCSSAPSTAAAISRLQASEVPGDVLAYDVTWDTSQSTGSELDVACVGLDPWTISDSIATQVHHVFLMGLVTGVSCKLTAKARNGGETVSAETDIQVAALPSYLPKIQVSLPAQAGTLAPGWTLIDLTKLNTDIPYSVAVVDEEGRYRWYFQYPGAATGADSPVAQYANGVVVGGDQITMSYITWQGRIVWTGPSNGTHEVSEAETPGDFYYIFTAPCSSLAHGTDVIGEYDPSEGKDVWDWTLCDHYTPPVDIGDWAHLNTVSLFSDKKSLLTSSRNQNALFKIDRASGKLIWTMGYAGEVEDGFHGDFAIADSDRFLHQHDATLLPSGNILMFDNGRSGVREYSRALEIAYTYDPSGTSEAHAVWQYRHSPDIFASIWGSAQRFDNGNTLVDFAECYAGSQSTIVEVSSSSKPLWEIKLPELWGVYRAERIAKPEGFVVH